MIKKEHFVALTASLALVLSGCETTDLVTDAISTAEEENTVIELIGPNGHSGSIKLPSSEESDESSESSDEKDDQISDKTDGAETSESTDGSQSEEKDAEAGDETEDGSEDENGESDDDASSGSKSEVKADEESTDDTDEESTENVEDKKDEESSESSEESTEKETEENTDDSTGKTDEETTENVEDKKDEESSESSEESTEKETEENTDDSTGKTDEESTEKETEENSDDSTGKTDEESSENSEESADKESEDKTEESSGSSNSTVPEKDQSESGSEKSEEEETTPEKDYSTNNKILMQKVEAARLAAIEAGAKSVSPILWNATEGIYTTEKSAVESGTKADLSTVLNDLIARYNGLENLAQAKDLKDEIDENNFASFRQATYNAGKEIYDDLVNPLSVIQSGSDFNKQAATAESDFRLVLRTAYNSLAQNERTAAYEAKLKADSVKAYVSRKDDYTHAVSLYRNGELRRSVDPKLANDSYKLSKEEFLKLFEEISAARAQAQKEIEEAKKSVAQSATAAEQADVEAPLGNEPVEGIEAEDAKLLDDDDFSNAGEAAEIEAPDEEQ